MTESDKNNSLHQAGRRAVKLLRDATEPVYLLDTQSRLVFANDALAAWIGVPLERLIGLECSSTLSHDAQADNQIAAILAPPKNLTDEFVFRKPVPRDTHRPSALIIGISLTCNLPEWICRIATQAAEGSAKIDPLDSASFQALETLLSIRSSYPRLDGLHSLVGSSIQAKRALDQCQLVIASASLGAISVLITGPEGTGKGETARALFAHRLRQRGLADREGRLYPVDCQLMDASLLRNVFEMISDLHPRMPWNAVLLEHLEALPESTHDMLLQALHRWPGLHWMATSRERHPEERYPASSVWRDLVHQLSIQRVDLAPLCDRMEDLSTIVEVLLPRVLAETSRVVPVRFLPDAMKLLSTYSWPGNVRELRKAMVHAIRESSDGQIRAAHLPIAIRTHPSKELCSADHEPPLDLDSMLVDFERACIERSLRLYPRNRAAAANWLGISRSRLLRRIEQLELDHHPSNAAKKAKPIKTDSEDAAESDAPIDFQAADE